jgi:hypothetical protein
MNYPACEKVSSLALELAGRKCVFDYPECNEARMEQALADIDKGEAVNISIDYKQKGTYYGTNYSIAFNGAELLKGNGGNYTVIKEGVHEGHSYVVYSYDIDSGG